MTKLPTKLRGFFCTKCGSHTCVPGTEHEKHPPCAKCSYLGFSSDLDYTEAQMLQFRRDALKEAADIIESLEKEIEQHKETNLNQYNKIMKILNEKVILQDEVERLEPLQFRQGACRRFCEATAYEIRIKQLESVCKVALDAIIPVSSYGRIGTKDTEQAALQTAISKLQGVLQ